MDFKSIGAAWIATISPLRTGPLAPQTAPLYHKPTRVIIDMMSAQLFTPLEVLRVFIHTD